MHCSYVKVRQLPQFAGCSIITMTSNTQQQQQQQHDPSNPAAAAANGSSSSSYSRELAVSAELDTLMLAEVLALTLEGGGYSRPPTQRGSAAAAAGSGGSSSSSSAALSREAAAALPWLKGLLWTMSMYYAGRNALLHRLLRVLQLSDCCACAALVCSQQ
jgi:hypothetical protein